MSSERQAATVRDLVEEAKKRIVFLIVSVVGLSYLMSSALYKSKSSTVNSASQNRIPEVPKLDIEKSDWRRKVNSPVVEDAIDQLTKHIVSEWVTDLWYSRITPDKQGPEELVQIINGVLGEISCRARNTNLIDLLTRDIIDVLCSHLELFRASKAKIEKHQKRSLSVEERDMELKCLLSSEDKLHPSLFSAEAEHKVLQHLMDGLISLTFKPKDLNCSLFCYIVRELLACAVMRPVLNLASPRFINERIESLVISLNKNEKGSTAAELGSQPKPNEKMSSDHFSRVLDPSAKGVELVQLKKDESIATGQKHEKENMNGVIVSKDPLLSMDTRSTRSWSSLPAEAGNGDGGDIPRHQSGGEWGDMLDVLSRRKTQALAPEHFDNMWAKGRNYKRKDASNPLTNPIPQGSLVDASKSMVQAKDLRQKEIGQSKGSGFSKQPEANNYSTRTEGNSQYHSSDEHETLPSDEVESTSSSSTSEDEETSTITGIDSPGVKVWDGKNIRNVASIHHPLESVDGRKSRKSRKGKSQSHSLSRTQNGRKRSRSSNQKGNVWQEGERTSFLLGDGQDILNSSSGNVKLEDSSDDSEEEMFSRISSGSNASSFLSSASLAETNNLTADFSKNSVISDSFLTLRCEVVGANIVKSGYKTFTVYSLSVIDMDNHSWSIKRRFRHFEELHRRLKEFPEYNLHLPPKHFLSAGLEIPVIQERCKFLDKYLKALMRIPTVSSSIEVWDFLSVDSQTYIFSNPLSIIETFPVSLDRTSRERRKEDQNDLGIVRNSATSRKENINTENKQSALLNKHDALPIGSNLNSKKVAFSSTKGPSEEVGRPLVDSSSDSDSAIKNMVVSAKNLDKTSKKSKDGFHASSQLPVDTASDSSLPSEWVPPNLNLPILDLVDVIFQLQDGGWIRRKAFWVAKQVLQLGMGDAFDDWLIEKIQLLRRGSVVASGIKKLEQILWPDGIFISKHPRRQRSTGSPSPTPKSFHSQTSTPLSSPKVENVHITDGTQQIEADQRAKLVYELMIDKAPAAVVGLVGRKEYERCAKDLYYFIQSSVVMKQLAFNLLELLLLSAFPELDHVIRQLHEEKEKFGKFK